MLIFLRLLLYRLQGKKTIIINESAGLGDYIHTRNYPKLFKLSEKYKEYKIIFCCVKRWVDFARKYDHNHIDVFIPISKPYNPKISIWFLKFFKFSIYIDFRANNQLWAKLNSYIKAEKVYNYDDTLTGKFYTERYNYFISKIIDIPDGFKAHFEEIIPSKKILPESFTLLVFGGYTVGALSKEQLQAIVYLFCTNAKNIMLLHHKKNPIFSELASSLPQEYRKYFINGMAQFETWELPYLVNKADFIIQPNASTYHITLAIDKPCICLSLDDASTYELRDNIQYLFDKNISSIPVEYIIEALKNNKYTALYFGN